MVLLGSATAQTTPGGPPAQGGSGHPLGGSGPVILPAPSCPLFMEIECNSPPSPQEPQEISIACGCGPGAWIRHDPEVVSEPASPDETVETAGAFRLRRLAHATHRSATASVNGQGYSSGIFFPAVQSATIGATARYKSREKEVWEGPLPACPRMVMLTAVGGSQQTIALSVAAVPGCSTSASSSVSGACSSLGKASADLNQTVMANAQVNAATSTVSISGNIGGAVFVGTSTVAGSISAQDSWVVRGAGSASGSATLSVKSDRVYCAFTNKPIVRLSQGNAAAAGSATVANGGTAAFMATAIVSLGIDG